MKTVFRLMCLGVFCCASVVADSRHAAGRALPATVEIEASSKVSIQNGGFGSPVLSDDDSDEMDRTESVTTTLVSGTIVSADGLIATNELGSLPPEAQLTVRLSDGRSLPGKVVVDDRRSKLQLVRIDAVDLPAIAIAQGEVAVGQSVVSVATLDGYPGTVIDGIVSGVNRARWEQWRAPLIQTNLQVGAGSSGSPVVNVRGELVGVVAAAAGGGPEERPSGTAFAVPAVMVREAIDAVKEDDIVTIQRGHLPS